MLTARKIANEVRVILEKLLRFRVSVRSGSPAHGGLALLQALGKGLVLTSISPLVCTGHASFVCGMRCQ